MSRIAPPPADDPLSLDDPALDGPHALVLCDLTGVMLSANPVAASIFGYERAELQGRPITQVLPGAGAMGDPHGAGPRPGSLVGLRKDGTSVAIELTVSRIHIRGSRYLIASLADMTARLNVEAQVVTATHELRDFQRIVAELAVRFEGVEPDALDDVIGDALRQVAEVLRLDQAFLWGWNAGETTALAIRSWSAHPEPSRHDALPIVWSPSLMSRLQALDTVWFSRVEDLADPIDRETCGLLGLRSAVALPLRQRSGSGALWILSFSAMTREIEWSPAVLECLRLFGSLISQALARRCGQIALQQARDQIQQLRLRPADPPVERRREVRLIGATRRIVAESIAICGALAQIEQVAATPATVLLRGETGAGKEVFAQTIHDLSPRHRHPMIVVNCAAIPAALIESELFGRERGAYTGALSRQIGRFEAAHQSTLFLDEIGDLPAETQVKLLRVLQERVIERLGSPQPIKVDVRIIAATHHDLEKAVQAGTFREDLFYRLNVFPIVVPPLRDRAADIPGLVWDFVDELSRAFGKSIATIEPASMRALQQYSWPGNVRELRNIIERAMILANSDQLTVPVPRQTDPNLSATAMTLAALEVDHIRATLESTNWRVRGQNGAASRLGLKPTTLESRMARLGITRMSAS